MPIVFDNHTRGNNDNNNGDNNGQQLLLLQQQQQQDFEEGRVLRSDSLQQLPLKKNSTATWSLHPTSPEHNNITSNDTDDQQQSQLLSSGNGTSLLFPLSSLPEPTETETRQSATGSPKATPSCLALKLDQVDLVSDQGDQDEVSWAALSQPDHRQRHHRPQQQQLQLQVQQGQQRSSSKATAYLPPLSVSTQQQGRLRGYYNGIDIDYNNTGAQQQQHEQCKQEENQAKGDNSYCPKATTAEGGHRGLDLGSPVSSSSSSPSLPLSSPLSFSFPSMPSLADNNPLLPSPLLLSYSSSSTFTHTCSPFSPPDSATIALPPLSALSSPSRSNSLSAGVVDLDPACVVRRGNVVLDTSLSTGKSGSSVAATSSPLSSLFSENSIPCKEEEPSQQTDSIVHCTSPSPSQASSQQQQQPFTSPAPPMDSSSSLVVAVSSPSSPNERRGRREQARTKRRRSMDDDSSINDNNSDGVPSPFPSPIEPDYSSLSTSKGLVGCTSEPTTETMSPNPTMDNRIASVTAGTTTFATVETVLLPIVESEKRRRKRRVSEGHDTTPAAKTTKKTETPVNNERLERRKKASATSSSATARPSCSYTTMIMEVFQASSKVKLDLPDIYSGIMSKYPFYRKAGKVWQSSVRHALSQSKFFCKVERRKDEPGKGSLWIVDSQNKQTPNPSRKRKASGISLDGGDRVFASACPAPLSKDAASSKLTCTTPGESLDYEKSREFHSSADSIPSPAASDDADDANTVRRSGRTRRPPRTKEADEYNTPVTHSRKPSLVSAASLSTPPSSPAPQDHHSETTAKMTSPLPPSSSSSTRKRSSSFRSDKSLTGSVVSRMNHFTIDLPPYNPAMSALATPAITTGTLPRKAPLDLGLASIPGVVTSPRIRRPPQKLAEFVSSEDFKAAPCGKRPSLVSTPSSSSLLSANQDRAAVSAPTTTLTPAATGAGTTSQRIERRGRKRARPDVESESSILQQQQSGGGGGGGGGRGTTGNRSIKRAMTVGDRTKDVVTRARQQSSSSLPAAVVPTAHSPVSASGCAPAFISLKDLELSHASLEEECDDDYDDDYDNDDDDQVPAGGRNSNRSGTRGVSWRRYGGGRPCQNETYEQRRLAGIQQIVVASLDWYEESDSDSDSEDVDIEGDSDIDMGAKNDTGTVNGSGGAVARSGCDSGFDSESDSCKGFVRESGWAMTTESTELADELDIDGTTTSSQEAFETVCIAPPEENLAAGGSLAEDVLASGMAVASHFLDHAGAGLVAGQDEVGSQTCADPSSVDVDTPSLLPTIAGIATSAFGAQSGVHDGIVNAMDGTESIKPEQEALPWATVPMIAGGILKELVAVTAAVSFTLNKMSISGVEGIEGGPMEVELEERGSGDATVHIAATTAAATASEVTELKTDNYMGWLNF